jgi:hypothetical protein
MKNLLRMRSTAEYGSLHYPQVQLVIATRQDLRYISSFRNNRTHASLSECGIAVST